MSETSSSEEDVLVVEGKKSSIEKRNIVDPIEIKGSRCSVDILIEEEATIDFVRVSGSSCSVHIAGANATVNQLEIPGESNTVEVSTHLTVRKQSNSGVSNSISEREFGPSGSPPASESNPAPRELAEDYIETTKEEAYRQKPWFGGETISYTEPVTNYEYCPNCRSESEVFLERKTDTVLFVFKLPLKINESMHTECIECAEEIIRLTEEERKNLVD
jgi:hypothetical protein